MSRVVEILKLIKEILSQDGDMPEDSAVSEKEQFKESLGKQPTLRYQSSKLGK